MPITSSTDVQTLPYASANTAADSTGLAAAKARLHEATDDFEAILVRQLLSSMRSTLTDGGMFGDGLAGDVYSSFMDDAIAEKVTESGGLGLSDILYNRLVKVIDPSETVSILPGTLVPAKDYGEF